MEDDKFKKSIENELYDLSIRVHQNSEDLNVVFIKTSLSVLVRISVSLGYSDWILKKIEEYHLK